MSSNTETALAPPPSAPSPAPGPGSGPGAVAKKVKKYMNRPARKQVKPGDVEKKETPQTGKEYTRYPRRDSGRGF
ncbi:hypothetical protein K435DRAFT_873556 [Dendrothele bispora CBS 962.96]|uniref:Uncharacterized protein n=1 Tax=Dendrothele bispora (strain CBS 962.96) TaxID=1314807 RepID=A0A4S8KYY0_DENBC|nr:hypothetical protein K435DRAFT_873556 [Dendrothele bispora CBS 962.96]